MDNLWATNLAESRSVAFFDALIGQQDRHDGNYRFDTPTGQLSVIDHGFAFPGGEDHAVWLFNESFFVEHRWAMAEQAIAPEEKLSLRMVLGCPATLGLEEVLSPDRLQRLHARAQRMLDTGEILQPGEW